MQISNAQAEEHSRHPHKIIKNINSIGIKYQVIHCEVKENGGIVNNIKRITELANVDQPWNLHLVFQEEDYQEHSQQSGGTKTVNGPDLEINISPVSERNRNDDKQEKHFFRQFSKQGSYRFKIIIQANSYGKIDIVDKKKLVEVFWNSQRHNKILEENIRQKEDN